MIHNFKNMFALVPNNFQQRRERNLIKRLLRGSSGKAFTNLKDFVFKNKKDFVFTKPFR